MATDKRGRKLPRGIRATQNGFEGRFMFRGTSYSVSGKTVREVQQRLTEARYKAEHGVTVSPEAITLADWTEVWLREYYAPTVRESSLVNMRSYSKHFLAQYGHVRLADIRPEHVQSILNTMDESCYSAVAIKRVAGAMGRIFRQAVRNGLIMRNPVDGASIPRGEPVKERTVLTTLQQETFMKCAEGSYFRDLFALALRTGMRHGELLALRSTDIDFRKGVIHVAKTMSLTQNGYTEGPPKTKASTRDIPISSGTAKLLREHMAAAKVVPADGRLFCDYDGKPFFEKRVNTEIRRIVQQVRDKRVPIPDFTFHTFRHTFATRAIESGMNPQTLKTILGHSSLAMTMDLYSHVMADTKAREMENIEAAFSGC